MPRLFLWSEVLYRLCFVAVFIGVTGLIQAQGNTKGSADIKGYTGNGGATPVSVNASTGQLSVSIPIITIPGLDGEGYQMSLNYAPPSPSSEASWVGYGWSLSPGSIERMQNGIADDFKGDIINISKKPDYTRFTGRIVGGGEIFSAVGGSIGMGHIWDSDRGLLPSVSLSLSGYGAGISYLQEGGEGAFTAGFNPVATLIAAHAAATKGSGDATDPNSSVKELRQKVKDLDLPKDVKAALSNSMSITQTAQSLKSKLTGVALAPFGIQSRGMMSMPSFENGVRGHSAGFKGSIQLSTFINIGGEVGFDTQWTVMEYTSLKNKKATGYMRGGEQERGMDFTQERLNALDENDKFIATPVATPDQFSVSAQGLAGSFRAHFMEPGTFHSDPVDYQVEQGPTVGLEFAAGATPPFGNVSGGASIAGQFENTLDTESWEASGSSSFGDYKKDVFFAFDGAPNLQRSYAEANHVIRAEENGSHRNLKLSVSTEGLDLNSRLVQSKWVRWNTVEEANGNHLNGGLRYPKRFCQQPLGTGALDAFRSVMDDQQIGEFQVVNEHGMVYTFGIPVLVRNQVDLSFNLPDGVDPTIPGSLENYKVVEVVAPGIGEYLDGNKAIEEVVANSSSDLIQGRIVEDPIASGYLLTSIVSPDYVDLTLNGPSEDDLGTWVKFNYTKDFGVEAGEWFKYRTPKWGNHFSEGNTADVRDDMASFSYGEKEVFRLVSIETRTHYAQFHEGERGTDGKAIQSLDAAALAPSFSAVPTYRLDSISLYAKGGGGADDLLQVVRLGYAPLGASLVPGIQGPGSAGLTLSDVVIQSHDVLEEENQRHFQFKYKYPSESPLPDHLEDRYGPFFSEYSVLNAATQNPQFSFNSTGAWGTYKLTGDSEFDVHHSWLDRREWPPSSPQKDPAAYCLKQLTMPGGVTVYPQYELGDYRYVQDEQGCIMVPLKGPFDVDEGHLQLKLDLDAVGARPDDMSTEEMVVYLEDYFRERKIYFKVRYSLKNALLNEPVYKFFTGFAMVQGVSAAGDVIQINLLEDGAEGTPLEVCLDYVDKFPKVATGQVDDLPSEDLEEAVHQFIQKLSSALPLGGACATMDVNGSFLRVPLFPGMDKEGGSLRVKRLLSLDDGLESEDALLTGTLYDYTEEDPLTGKRVSSGVAANEPKSMYDECGMFSPLAKVNRQWEWYEFLSKATQGKDAEKQTGPIGESFLPGPQVLYGEVVKRQVHEGESTVGHSIERFFTHKDFPTEVTWSDENASQLEKIDDQLPFGVYNKTRQELWYAQGFQIEHSSMPGQTKGTTSYGGRFDVPESWYPVSSTRFEYFQPDEPLPLMDRWVPKAMDQPQFDELYFHGRKMETHQENGSAELDVSVQWVPAPIPAPVPIPVWVPSGFASYSVMDQVQAVHGTTRIVSRPVMMKAISKTETGKTIRIENLAFDPVTLEPVVKATSDGFTGLAFDSDGLPGADMAWENQRIAYNFPAHRWYPEMGGKYKNDRLHLISGEGRYEGVSIKKVNSNLFGHYLRICLNGALDYCERDLMGVFHPGDLIRVTESSGFGGDNDDNYYHVHNVSGNQVFLYPSENLGTTNTFSILNDATQDVNVEIISSGLKNQMKQTSGSVEVYDAGLNVTATPRISTELEALIATMNEARPQGFPSAVHNQASGTAFLHGVSAFSDTLKIQEEGCQMVGEVCALQHFGIVYRGFGCNYGHIIYPYNVAGNEENIRIIMPNVVKAGTPSEVFVIDNDLGCPSTTVIPIAFNPDQDRGGRFDFDHDLGAIVWVTEDNPCNPVVVFTPCRDLSTKVEVDQVIAGSETVFRDDVPFEFLEAGNNPYESGTKGRWVEHSSWVAQSEASSFADGGVNHSRQAGIMEVFEAVNEDFVEYMETPYVAEAHPWIRQSRSTLYDRRGHPLESLDALGLYQSREYGAEEQVVTWESDGARNASCAFESFERKQASRFTDSKLDLSGFQFGAWEVAMGHTGKRSLRLNVVGSATRSMRLGQFKLDERCAEPDGGIEIRLWAHSPKNLQTGLKDFGMDGLFTVKLTERGEVAPGDGSTPANPNLNTLSASGTAVAIVMDSLVQTGRWVLLEARFTSADMNKPEGTPMIVELEWTGQGGGMALIDDVRFRPFNTAMNCKVHDGDDFRVLAELDENHFAKKYQYNRLDELIRVQVETTGGWKTVSENIQHLKFE